jgi:hypothetical protein
MNIFALSTSIEYIEAGRGLVYRKLFVILFVIDLWSFFAFVFFVYVTACIIAAGLQGFRRKEKATLVT